MNSVHLSLNSPSHTGSERSGPALRACAGRLAGQILPGRSRACCQCSAGSDGAGEQDAGPTEQDSDRRARAASLPVRPPSQSSVSVRVGRLRVIDFAIPTIAERLSLSGV